jgi:hypothetical protein
MALTKPIDQNEVEGRTIGSLPRQVEEQYILVQRKLGSLKSIIRRKERLGAKKLGRLMKEDNGTLIDFYRQVKEASDKSNALGGIINNIIQPYQVDDIVVNRSPQLNGKLRQIKLLADQWQMYVAKIGRAVPVNNSVARVGIPNPNWKNAFIAPTLVDSEFRGGNPTPEQVKQMEQTKAIVTNPTLFKLKRDGSSDPKVTIRLLQACLKACDKAMSIAAKILLVNNEIREALRARGWATT